MYIDCNYHLWNLKDSAADSKLKLLKEGEVFGEEKPGGEKRIHIGSSANKSTFDAFFFPNGEKTVLFEFSKSDLLLYLIDAKDEFMHPKQSYRLDISKLYDSLLKETMSIKDDTLYVRFETNIDKRYYLARPKGDEYYTNYNYISHICLPYLTDIVFIRAEDETGKYHFFLKPKFINKTTSKVVPPVDEDNPYTGPTIQKIYYGCPGTGKSREVKKLTEGLDEEKTVTFDDGTTNIFRTTFHPDYDYTTFVGCYKPVKNAGVLDYKFVPQVFTNAYVAAKKHPETPIYLIIEEINRGNCAQIFGDLFQLLDRKNGVSEFPIDTEEELMKYLRDEAGIEDCKKLCLPANFNIYATMNTSDQSLFPMDSAFKRRWEMKYVKINYDIPDADFIFSVNGIDYHWVYYLPFFNDKITEASDSEDKQMGEFFIRKNMTSEEFKNKVMFYLWNDVCKDLYAGNNSPQSFFFRDLYGKPFKFTQLFNEPKADASDEEKNDPYKNGDVLLAQFLYYIEHGKKKSPKSAATPTTTEGEETTDTE